MRPARRPRSKSNRKTVTFSFPKRFLLVLSLIILGLFAGIVWWVRFVPAKWGLETTQNIILVSNNIDGKVDTIIVGSISYEKHTILLHSIPATELVKVPGGYGEYPLKSIRSLLSLDKKKLSEMIPTYSYVLGIPVDGVWTTESKTVFDSIKDPNKFAQAILWKKIETGLGIQDRFKLAQFFGQQQPKIDQFTSLDSWQEKQAQRLPAEWKNCRLTIVNSTAVVGLGGRVARVLERGGAIIMRLTDQAQVQPTSRFTVQPGVTSCQDLGRHVTDLFPNKIEYRQDLNVFARTRSEAELILGEDLGEFFQE